MASIPDAMEELSKLVKDKPEQEQRFREIKSLSQRKIEIMNQNVARLRAIQQGATDTFRLDAQDKITMDAIRRQITDFSREEEILLSQRKQELNQQQVITIGVLGTTVILGVLGSLAAVYLFDQLDRELAERQTGLRESKIRSQAILDNVVDGIITIIEQ